MNSLFTAGAFVLSIFGSPVLAAAPDIPPLPIMETLQDKANRIAIEHGISTTTLSNLIQSESNWDVKADNGYDRGIAQINRASWPEISDSEAFDPDWALHWTAEKIAQGDADKWVACNCYSFAQAITGKLPKMMDIVPNSNYPRVGGLVVLRYKNNKHIGVVKAVLKEGVLIRESNFEPCKIDERLIEWTDPHLKGFVSYND